MRFPHDGIVHSGDFRRARKGVFLDFVGVAWNDLIELDDLSAGRLAIWLSNRILRNSNGDTRH